MTELKPSAGHPTERPSMNTPNQLIEAAKALDACEGFDLEHITGGAIRQQPGDWRRWVPRWCDPFKNLAAAIEASTQDGWQPISSAPKDGTEVQLSDGVYVSQGYWWTGDTDGVHKWMSSFTYEGEPFELDPVPIFWMPLPNPPTAQPDEQVCRFNCRDGIIYGANPALDGHQPCPDCKRDEQVCSTCGGNEIVLTREYSNFKAIHKDEVSDDALARFRQTFGPEWIECPDCQPVPPSEGEIECGYCGTASHTSEEHVAAPSEGEVAAGKLDENFAQTILTIANLIGQGRTDALAGFNAEYLRDNVARLLETLATNTPPDGHVAVYLPVEDVRDGAAGRSNGVSWARHIEACRTALEVE